MLTFFMLRMFTNICFGVFYSSLSIYLILVLHLSKMDAILYTTTLIALHYGLTMLGFLISPRWISEKIFLYIGNFLHFIGVLLIFQLHANLNLGITIFVLGSMGVSNSLNLLVSKFYPDQLAAQQKMFFLNYAGMNLGSTLGYLCGGFMQIFSSTLPILALNMATLVGATFCTFYLKIDKTQLKKSTLLGFSKTALTLALILFSVFILVTWKKYLGLLFGLAWLFCVIFATYRSISQHYWKNGKVFLSLCLACLVYWSCYFLIPTILSFFVQFNVTRTLFSFTIPTAWLYNIDTILVVIGCGLFAKKLKDAATITWYLKMGMRFIATAFLCLVIGVFTAKAGLVSLPWIVFFFVFLAGSEIFFVPISFSLIEKLIPKSDHSLFMGIWFSIIGISVLIAGSLSTVVSQNLSVPSQDSHTYFIFFSLLTIVLYGSSILISVKKHL